MKDYKTCCDEVAKKWGLINYSELKSQGRPDLENFYTEVGQLYATECVKEAVKLARQPEGGDKAKCHYFYETEQEILSKLNL